MRPAALSKNELTADDRAHHRRRTVSIYLETMAQDARFRYVTLVLGFTPPGEELEDVMPRFQNHSLKRLAAAHHAAHPLVRFARNANGDQLPGASGARQVDGIALIMLALDARPLGDERIAAAARSRVN